MKYKDSLVVNADGSAVDLTLQVGDLIEMPNNERILVDGDNLESDSARTFMQRFDLDDCTLVMREGCKPKTREGLTDAELQEIVKSLQIEGWQRNAQDYNEGVERGVLGALERLRDQSRGEG